MAEFILVCIGCSAISLFLGNIFAISYGMYTLDFIERCPEMYGRTEEIETAYITILLLTSHGDMFRRYVKIAPKITWERWFKFKEKHGYSVDTRPDSPKVLVTLLKDFKEKTY